MSRGDGIPGIWRRLSTSGRPSSLQSSCSRPPTREPLDDDRELMEELCVCIFQDSLDAQNKWLDEIRNSKYDKLDDFGVKLAPRYDPAEDRCYGRWESRYTDRYTDLHFLAFDWSRSGGIPNPPRCCTSFKVQGDGTVCWTDAP